jgi:DNA-binding MarR family transcriptional regulator
MGSVDEIPAPGNSGAANSEFWPANFVADCFTAFPNSFRDLLSLLSPSEFKFLCWLHLETYGFWVDGTELRRKYTSKSFGQIAKELAVTHNTAERAADILTGAGLVNRCGGQGAKPKLSVNLELLRGHLPKGSIKQKLDSLTGRFSRPNKSRGEGKKKGSELSQKLAKLPTSPNSGEVLSQNLANHPYIKRKSFSKKALRAKKPAARATSHSQIDPEFEAWAESVYARHPKKTQKADALTELRARFSSDPDARKTFDSNHTKWCQTKDWRKENGRFCPKLHIWIQDDGWANSPNETAEGKSRAVDGLDGFCNMEALAQG